MLNYAQHHSLHHAITRQHCSAKRQQISIRKQQVFSLVNTAQLTATPEK